MNVNLAITKDSASAAVREIRRLTPKALANILNKTANTAQTAIRTGLPQQGFTIAPSRLQFVQRLVKRARPHDFATEQMPVAAVRIAGPEGSEKKTGGVLSRHEEGGQRTARGNLFYMPTKELRRGAYDLPPRSMYPKALGIFGMRGIDGSVTPGSKRGKRRRIAGVGASLVVLRKAGLGGTWLEMYQNGEGAIYQRQGEGRDGRVRLWDIRPSLTLPPRLRFVQTMVDVIDKVVDRIAAQTLTRLTNGQSLTIE